MTISLWTCFAIVIAFSLVMSLILEYKKTTDTFKETAALFIVALIFCTAWIPKRFFPRWFMDLGQWAGRILWAD